MVIKWLRVALVPLLFCAVMRADAAETFRIAEYNVDNYLEVSNGTRPAKSEAAKTAVRETIRGLKPDVIALEEIGGTNALLELQGSLKAEGLDLPFWELVNGSDTNIQVAVLSRLPITARRPQTNDYFLLAGRRWRVSRGFAEVDIRVNDRFSFTLMAVHLKSKLTTPGADEADIRLEEAKLLRSKIDARLAANPRLNLVVLGDFNDLQDSEPMRAIIGRGSKELVDTRPAERNGDATAATSPVVWTEHYAKEDVYSRIDYLLLSRAMAAEWDRAETFIPVLPNWEAASDHRPLVATITVDGR